MPINVNCQYMSSRKDVVPRSNQMILEMTMTRPLNVVTLEFDSKIYSGDEHGATKQCHHARV